MKRDIFYSSFLICSLFVFFTSCQGCSTTSSLEERGNASLEAEISSIPEEIIEEQKSLYTLREVKGDSVTFNESWGYVSQSRISDYNKAMPVTDVCLFAAEVNSYGELTGIPSRKAIDTGDARCHLVIVCDSRSLTHFVINPEYDVRKKMLNDIVKASAGFDGVQLDFEYVPARDRKHYISFISDLRYKLNGKMLSVCVPARFSLSNEDIYPYAEIATYCDRVFVMAYDEHWSTSKAGPIASVDWCKKVLNYAQRAIPSKKLVMGIPFYGRTWADTTTSGAWTFNGVNRVLKENEVVEITYENDIPSFTYTTEVKVTGYFNDVYSAINLCRIYQGSGVKNIGFWRIGQEDPQFWDYLEVKK